MKRRKVRTAVLGLMALLMWSGSMAAEEIYLHGDTNIPMILNTGGIDNDGNTGVFYGSHFYQCWKIYLKTAWL